MEFEVFVLKDKVFVLPYKVETVLVSGDRFGDTYRNNILYKFSLIKEISFFRQHSTRNECKLYIKLNIFIQLDVESL